MRGMYHSILFWGKSCSTYIYIYSFFLSFSLFFPRLTFVMMLNSEWDCEEYFKEERELHSAWRNLQTRKARAADETVTTAISQGWSQDV